jgi:peptidoglycan/LPS O-acetylase OafA/YrhL
METSSNQAQPIQANKSSAYEILPNGKKRYLRATAVDIIFSILLPFWGFLIGAIALARGEQKRGLTMVLIGIAGLALYAVLKGMGH